jgi:hypothetical protein
MPKFHPFLTGLVGGCALLWLANIAVALAAAAPGLHDLARALKEHQMSPQFWLPLLLAYLPVLLVAMLVGSIVFSFQGQRLAALAGVAVPVITYALFTSYMLLGDANPLQVVLTDGHMWASIANVAVGLGLALLIAGRRTAATAAG